MPPTFVIVGASLAGTTGAITLRQEGFDGEIILLGEESGFPYERPALSKQYLRGEWPFEKTLVRPAAFYGEHDISLRLGNRATGIDARTKAVVLADGEQIHFDKLLVATGVRGRRLPIPGVGLGGVLPLRSVTDADLIRAEIKPGARAVVVGMGFIGCEVAASLRQRDVAVVALDPSPGPLHRVLGPRVGHVLAAVHGDHGVEMIFNDGVAAFEGNGRVRRVVTTGGRHIDCDFAVVGVGVQPEVGLLADSGIEADNGVLVDEHCRSSVADVYAAGDVANHFHSLFQRRVRVEHWQNAMQQGAAAARSMLDRSSGYAPVHWFWSDQYDVNVQYAGAHTEVDEFVVRGSLEKRQFLGFYLNAGRADGIVAFGRGRELRQAMPLIASRAKVDVRLLQDEAVEMRDVVHRLQTQPV